jgi:hypothetical protein
MKFARRDYNNRIIDIENRIPEDEPCFLLRGQDALAPKLLLTWAMELRLAGGDPNMAEEAEKQAQDMLDWQKSHGSKTPDVYRESGEMQFIKERIENKISAINSGHFDVNLSELQSDAEKYYGPNSIQILMPMDLKSESRLKSLDSLVFDDFNLDDSSLIQSYKARIIIYCSRNKQLRVLKYG